MGKRVSPTQRSLAWLRGRGWLAWVVEQWVPFRGKPKEGDQEAGRKAQVGGFRRDVWGFGDILVLDDQRGALMVNACGADVMAHVTKYDGNLELSVWLTHGNRFWVVGWRKVRSGRGTKEMIYKPRVVRGLWNHETAKIAWEEVDVDETP